MSDGGGEEILHLTDVTRRFGTVTAVDRLSLTLREGEFLTLLGPSGCGKTTALRVIAGFEPPDEGAVRFRDTDVTSWSPQRRGFGMVFQNYALFPHLNVFENVAFGLRARKMNPERIRGGVRAALEVVDLAEYGERAVQALSGGQQQRVALARAIAIEPPLLLLDEPLSNLDQTLRVRMRTELRELVKGLGITAVFVTHDQEEAFDLSDRIAVMDAGKIRQIGTPRRLYEEPADRFVASFVGRANALPVRVERGGAALGDGVVWPLGPTRDPARGVNGNPEASGVDPAGSWVLLFRPEDLRFVGNDAEEALGDPLPGVVRDRRFRGGLTLYQVEVTARSSERKDEPAPVVIEVSGAAGGPAPGARVLLQPKRGARLHLFSGGGTP